MSWVGLSVPGQVEHASSRWRFFLTMIALAAVCFVAAPASAAPILSVSPASADVLVGESFTIDILIEDVTDLYAFQFDITFDPIVLNADDVVEGAFLSSGGRTTFFIPGLIDLTLGSITFTANSLIGPGPGVSGDGVLATVAFTANAPVMSNIALTNVVLLDSFLADISDVSLRGGDVTVRELSSVPEPSGFFLMSLGTAFVAVCRRRMRA